MSSEQITSLLALPSVKHSRQRVLELLDSKFNSLESLSTLEVAVSEAQELNVHLQRELSLSQDEVDESVAQTRSSAEAFVHTAQELSLLRHSLADELAYLTQGFISPFTDGETQSTLLEDIEALHRSLKELQTVKDYVRIIQRALQLSESSIAQFHSSAFLSSASLTEYKSLNDFVNRVLHASKQANFGAGEQRPRLINFIEEVRDRTWADIKSSLTEALLASAEKLKWPLPVDYATINAEDSKGFEKAFSDLLHFQRLGEAIQSQLPGTGKETDGLYSLQAMVQPINLRFKYHFEGTRPTNRLDRPEWYFTHVLNAAHDHRLFMDTIIQPLLSVTGYRDIDAWCEFVLLLLPLVTRKLKRTMPSLLSRPSLLAHTIYQSLAFDATLIEEGFTISRTSTRRGRSNELKATDNRLMDNWAGVSEAILSNKEWFGAWLAGEKKFTEDQYLEIIADPVAWIIVDDDAGENNGSILDKDFKTTNSARRIKALVEQVTDRYSPLPDFNHRTQFLISVQLPVLELYHSRIRSSLDAFETLSSAFVRAVPGALGVSFGGKEEGKVNVDTGGLTWGTDGVQRLCKALVSAKFMQTALATWGEEAFFLELWIEINHRAALRDAAKINSSLPAPQTSETGIPEDTIFEELVTKYDKLSGRSEEMIVQQICGEIETSLKPHLAALVVPNLSQQGTDVALSHTLLAPIAFLSSHLSLLRSILIQTTLVALYRRISSRIALHILQREILHRGYRQISLQNGKALLTEYELWIETCHAALNSVTRNRVETPWLKLLQAGRLLSLEGERRDAVMDATFGIEEDDEWERIIREAVGIGELGRGAVATVLRTREDCER